MVLRPSLLKSLKHLLVMFILISFIIILNFSRISGGQSDNVNIVLYVLDVEPLFIKKGFIYIINDELCINCSDSIKMVLIDKIISKSLIEINDWPKEGHPFLKGLMLDSEIGPYKSGYFKDKILEEVNRLLISSGLKSSRVLIQGNTIIIVSKSFSHRHFNSQFIKEIGRVYFDTVAEMIVALENEGFNVDISSFLYGIKSRVNVVFIKSPFNPYISSQLTENIVSKFESLSTEMLSDKYGFLIKGIGVTTYLGSYYVVLPLNCEMRGVNISYSYTSIDDILPSIEKFRLELFGYENPLIVVPISSCNASINLKSDGGASSYVGSESYLKELDINLVKSEPILLSEILLNYPPDDLDTHASEPSEPSSRELIVNILTLATALSIIYVVIRGYLLRKL